MLFKESLNIDLAEIKQYLSVSQNGSFTKIRPHIAAAEILYVKDLLGEVLFNKLDEWYNSEESGSTSSSVSASPSIQLLISGSYNNQLGGMDFNAVDHGFIEPVFFWYVNDVCVNPNEGDPGYRGMMYGNHYQVTEEMLVPQMKVYCMVGAISSNLLYSHFNQDTGWYANELEVTDDEIIIIDEPFSSPMLLLQGSGSTSVSQSASIQVESDAALAALLLMVQRVLINFAYYIGADEYSLHITDAGMQIVTDETHKTAFQWQVEAAKASWLNKAYLFSDVLLLYLESHKTDYPSWVSSDSFTETMDSLLNTTKLFNDAFHIRNSRRLFLALKPIIRSIESKYAAYTLSQEYYDSLLVLLKTSAITAADSLILKKIRPAIAHLAMAEAITRFSIDVFPEGVYSNLVSSFGSVTAKNPAGKLDKAVAIEKLQAEGLAEMQGVQIYLDANASASKYKTYFDSSRYVDPSITVNRSEFKNSTDKGICLL